MDEAQKNLKYDMQILKIWVDSIIKTDLDYEEGSIILCKTTGLPYSLKTEETILDIEGLVAEASSEGLLGKPQN